MSATPHTTTLEEIDSDACAYVGTVALTALALSALRELEAALLEQMRPMLHDRAGLALSRALTLVHRAMQTAEAEAR